MTTPRVIELPRRLEPVTRDTFLAATEAGPRGELAQVIAFVPRERRRRPAAPVPSAAA